MGRAGRVALVSGGAGGGHAGLGETRGDADPHRETGGGAAAPLSPGQTGGAEDDPPQQGQRNFTSHQPSVVLLSLFKSNPSS